jgi:hypothetical protein
MPSRALHNEHFHLVSTVLNVAYIVENQRFTSENLLGQPAKLTKLLTLDIWTIWETIDSCSVSLLERFSIAWMPPWRNTITPESILICTKDKAGNPVGSHGGGYTRHRDAVFVCCGGGRTFTTRTV